MGAGDPLKRANRAAKFRDKLAAQGRTEDTIPLWERNGAIDTSESWPYFVAFRDGLRRLERLRYALDDKSTMPLGLMPSLLQLRNWHDSHHWAARVDAYDRHMDAIVQSEKEHILGRSAEDRTARHLSLLDDVTEVAEREAAKLAERGRSSQAETMKPGELVKVVETAIKLERLVRGESTDNTKTELDLTGMSDAALEELIAAGQRGK